MTFSNAPYIDPQAANRQIAEEGIADLRFLPAGFFKSRRTDDEDVATAKRAAPTLTQPEEDAAAVLRARVVACLSLHGADTRPQAAVALALRTDAEPEPLKSLLASLADATVLNLPRRDRSDPAEAAEAERIEGIAIACVAAERPEKLRDLVSSGVDLPTAQALLTAMPASAAAQFEARMLSDTDWFGDMSDDIQTQTSGGRIDASWSRAVSNANARFVDGSAEAHPAGPIAP